MDRERAKDIVKGYLGDYLQGKGINTSKPFTCLNPDHPDRHPSMSYDRQRQRCKCFSCGVSYDIFDVIGLDYGLTDDKAKFEKAYSLYGLLVDSTQAQQEQQAHDQKAAKDFTEYYRAAAAALAGSPAQEYLRKRGISDEVAAKYWLGYEPAYKTAGTTWQALIIPTGKGSYVARNLNSGADPKARYRNKGASLIFNSKALYNASMPVFVTEGELDALSIIEAGGEAIGLGSTSNYRQLVNMLEKQPAAQPLILALDADKEGQKAEDELAQELTRLQASFYRHSPFGSAKDANEALVADPAGFAEELRAAERAQEAEQEAIAEAARAEYMKTSAAEALKEFEDGITESANTPAISTGFSNLDELLDGGLYKGLYIFGAISSLGKTSLALQIVDQLAQQGHDCLVFSLEMARSELIARSISRLTFQLTRYPADAKTARGITAGARYKNYGKEELALIRKAQEAYKDYAGHIFIHEGIGDIGIEKVKEVVQQHISITGNRPIVLIDYLQILAPYDMRSTDKQNTDKAVLELKRLSRDYSIPVIGISSFNRQSYTEPVNNASFKESGAIEYCSDVLIGLQYEGMDYQDGESDTIRQKRIRELIKKVEAAAAAGEAQPLQAKVLKNRNGRRGQTTFDYYAKFNCFKEGAADDAAGAADPFRNLRNR